MDTLFPTDITGLPEAIRPQVLELADGDELHLRPGPVANRLGEATVRMLGYNGSILGPALKVRQGSEIVVHVTNDTDVDTTVHWHGLRLENRYDGVPHETQEPIPPGGDFTYRIQFPDAHAAGVAAAVHLGRARRAARRQGRPHPQHHRGSRAVLPRPALAAHPRSALLGFVADDAAHVTRAAAKSNGRVPGPRGASDALAPHTPN